MTMLKVLGMMSLFATGWNLYGLLHGVDLTWWRLAIYSTNAIVAVIFVREMLRAKERIER